MKVIIFLTFCFINNLSVFSQSWQSIDKVIGNGEATSLCTDRDGNIIATGTFIDSITFGATTLKGKGQNIFIVKYDEHKNLVWAKNFAGNQSSSINVDLFGNIFLTGWFSSKKIIIDPIILTNAGGYNPGSSSGQGSPCTDMFIAKFDKLGNVQWAKSIGGKNNESGRSISTDLSGNAFVLVSFASDTIVFDSFTFTKKSDPQNEMFIAKYNPNGQVLWAKKSTGDAACITTDNDGNVFATGEFWETLVFGNKTLSTTTSNAFILKYDGNGNEVWAASPLVKSRAGGRSICTDNQGNVFVVGWFNSSSITFGPATLMGNGQGSDPFIAKYDRNGNALWAKGAEGTYGYNDYCSFVTSDKDGNIYVAGYFERFLSSIIFDSNVLIRPDISDFPSFIVKYNTDGKVLCATALASGGNSNIGISADKNGNVCIAGGFAVKPFVIGTDTLTLNGHNSIFFYKYNCSSIKTFVKEPQLGKDNIFIYPNPSSGIFFLDLKSQDSKTEIYVYTIIGACISNSKYQKTEDLKIDLAQQPKGIYFIEIVSDGIKTTKKIVLQ